MSNFVFFDGRHLLTKNVKTNRVLTRLTINCISKDLKPANGAMQMEDFATSMYASQIE